MKLKYLLVLKIENNLKDYLSCEVKFSKDMKKAWLGQPHLIKNLEAKFGDRVRDMREYKTAGTPGFQILRTDDVSDNIGPEEQKLYRSGVGMLLYLVKHSRPDIAYATQELSKVFDGVSRAAYKELHQVIKFVLDTKSLGIKRHQSYGVYRQSGGVP